MLRFRDKDDFLEIALAMQENADLPSRGDAYLQIRVRSSGFEGHNDLWVAAPEFHAFCAALVTLERDRRGEARLEGISPGKLDVRIRSVDRKGHMAAEGVTGYHVQRENSLQWHAIHFGFEFDPSQLLHAVSLDWIRLNVSKPC